MTVKDLKECLEKVDENLQVIVKDRFDDGSVVNDTTLWLITDKQNYDNAIETKLYL